MLRLVLLAIIACMVDSQFIDREFMIMSKNLLGGHNSRRNLLTQGNVPGQPAAADMKDLVWDKELQEKAQKWADRNIYEHNPDRTVPSGRFQTGENLYKGSFSGPEESALKMWWDEHKHYSYEQNQSTNGKAVGHYTQMAWANTKYVGCGMHKGSDGQYFIVCNYGPGGNVAGQRPYKKN